MQMRCQVGQRNTFPLKLCALLLVKLTKMGVTGKPDKTSPTPQRQVLLFTFGALETHLLSPWKSHDSPSRGRGVQASGSFKFINLVDSLWTNQPMTGMTKLSLLKEFIKNLRIIHAPGHLLSINKKTVQVIAC